MPYSINGVSVNNISKINGYTMQGQNNIINGVSINVCLEYTLINNNLPPGPPMQFDYTNCAGDSTFSMVPAGGQDIVCAIVNTVMIPIDGSATPGSPC